MAATRLWVLLELLCGLHLIVANAASDDARIESLIAIKQRENGVELSVFPKYFGTESPASEPTHTMLVSGHHLSLDCGPQYFRCKPLPVATQNTSNGTAYQLFVPLSGGLLITELNIQSKPSANNNSKMVFGSYRILTTPGCSPTAIFKIYNSHYTMCTNLQNKLVSLYEIQVNKTSIEQTEISSPLVTVTQLEDFTDASDVVNMSNFLVSTDDLRIPFIYFAVDNFLFAIAPLDYSVAFDFVPIGTTRCRYIHRLERVSSSQILAYCSSEFVYFDTERENWVSEHSYTDSGVPYLCPNEMYGVNAFQNYLEYSIGQSKGTLSHVNVDSGVCFNGAGGQNFFAYNDKVTDTTTLMNLTSVGQKKQLCKNMDCLPVIAVEDPVQYLIVRWPSGDGRVKVLDVEANFSTIISTHNLASDMFTIVHVKAPLHHSLPGPSRHSEITRIVIIIGGAIVAAIVVMTVPAIVVGYYANKWLKQHRRYDLHGHGAQETPIPTDESQLQAQTLRQTNQEVLQGQPQYKPVEESQSGNRDNCMQAGGNSNNCLGQLGEEEEQLQQEKKLNEDYTTHTIDNEKVVGPHVMLHESSSLATAPLSLDETIHMSNPSATTAADSDTGSEDSRMNSDREPLLENSG